MSVKVKTFYTAIALCIAFDIGSSQAAEVTELASSFDNEDDPFDFNLTAGYRLTLSRGEIRREMVGLNPSAVEIRKELTYSLATHYFDLRAEIGIGPDLQLHIGLPIILSMNKSLDFAQNGGASCDVPPGCVTRNNSTLANEGFFDKSAMSDSQINVAGPEGAPGGFLLPTRFGFNQLDLGLSWAIFNQKKDSTKPTWVLGFEARLAVSGHMEYDPNKPSDNTVAGQGIHQFHFWTTVSRRYRYLDPWMTFFYLLPTPTPDSLFAKTNFNNSGQANSGPSQRGGIEAGLEIIPWEKPAKNYKLSIDLRGKLEAVFEGSGYSPIWEIFANSPKLIGPCTANSTSLPWTNDIYCQSTANTIPFPGITRIENHLILGGSLAVNAAITEFFKASMGFSLSHEQEHIITLGDAGTDYNANGAIDETSDEMNPMYRPIIDLVGKRFKVANTTVFDFFILVKALF